MSWCDALVVPQHDGVVCEQSLLQLPLVLLQQRINHTVSSADWHIRLAFGHELMVTLLNDGDGSCKDRTRTGLGHRHEVVSTAQHAHRETDGLQYVLALDVVLIHVLWTRERPAQLPPKTHVCP